MRNNIHDKGFNDCTGCSACAIVCPHNAINITFNKEGFIIPAIDKTKCTNCGLCKKVCYKYFDARTITPKEDYKNKKVIAVLNNYYEEMHTVSSAGVASQLAKYYYNNGFNVCGVVFNPETNICKHKIAESENDIRSFKGSKYLQSFNYDAFNEIANSAKKSIIFGTPCQIYGLKKVAEIKKTEDRYIFIDLFCAGVPSFNLWKKYKSFLSRNFGLEKIKSVNFRDKTQGWHKFSIKVSDNNNNNYRQNLFNDLFYSFFLKKTCLNIPCYSCLLRHHSAFADIRLGDFWGDKYKIYDDGIGLTVLLTEKGEKAWDKIKTSCRYEECNSSDIFDSQKIDKIKIPKNHKEIIKALASEESLESINAKYEINKIGYKKNTTES